MRLLQSLALTLITLMSLPVAHGETESVLESSSYQEGLRALEDQLPDLAIRRLQAALNKSAKNDSGTSTAETRLAEAFIRAGQAEAALPLLEKYPENDDALFWKANALLSLGRLRESEQVFARVAEKDRSRRKDLSNMARARILASLRDDRELSLLFAALGNSTDTTIITESQLLHATVLLDKDLLNDCAQLLSKIIPETASHGRFLSFLKGRHALLQKDYQTAENILKPFTESTENLSPELYQSAALAYSEALYRSQKNGPAIEFLLDFINKNSESLYLSTCFKRLTDWSRNDDVLHKLVLQKLEDWSTPANATAQTDLSASVISATPNQSPLMPYALYHRARLLAEANEKSAVAQAKSLLARLRIETPLSPLVANSLLETSQLHLAEQNKEAALASLRALEQISGSPSLQAHAAELSARIQFDDGDYESAANSFSRMREHFAEGGPSHEAYNTGISLLLAGNSASFEELKRNIDSEELMIALQLEQTLLQASNLEEGAVEKLSHFLQNHGDHPRAAEARIAVAELSLLKTPPDNTLAANMLESVNTAALSEPLALRHLLTQLKLAELTGEEEHWESAIDSANNYLSARPMATLKPAVRFKLAEAYYRNNDFSKSQLLFQQVANDESAESYHEVALFFAARAAIKVTTPEARAEAINLFKRVLTMKGRLADDARLKLAQTYLDSGNYDQALEMLDPLLAEKTEETKNLDALFLKAEALRAEGSSDSDQKALEIYSATLKRKDLSYAKSNHIHYLKGLTLEKLDRPEDALDTLYQVLNRENLPEGAPITEWSFYYDCGSKAISLLLDREDPIAAHALARKIADSGGPKSEDFAARADDIQLKHMIMEE